MYSQQITGEQRLRLLAWPMLAGLVDTYDEEKAAAMFRVFVKNGTWQTPTLSILWGFVARAGRRVCERSAAALRAEDVERQLGPACDLLPARSVAGRI